MFNIARLNISIFYIAISPGSSRAVHLPGRLTGLGPGPSPCGCSPACHFCASSTRQGCKKKKYLYRETTNQVCCCTFLLLPNLKFCLYDVIAGVLHTRDGQHEEQRDSGGEPGQGGHRRDGLSGMAAGFRGGGGGEAGQQGSRAGGSTCRTSSSRK